MNKSEVQILTPLILRLQELNSEAAELEPSTELGIKLNVIHGFTMAIEHIEQAFQETKH
jgi:hypothetical protein